MNKIVNVGILFALLLFYGNAFAQKAKRHRIVLNGKPTTQTIQEIAGSDSVLNIDVVVNKKIVALRVDDNPIEYTDKKRTDTTLVVITRKYARQQYRLKLAKLSKDYRTYLDTSKTADDAVVFVLNKVTLGRDDADEFLKTLYDIPANKLKSVVFQGRHYNGVGRNEQPILAITTKKY